MKNVAIAILIMMILTLGIDRSGRCDDCIIIPMSDAIALVGHIKDLERKAGKTCM